MTGNLTHQELAQYGATGLEAVAGKESGHAAGERRGPDGEISADHARTLDGSRGCCVAR